MASPKILCRCESIQGAVSDRRYDGKWWEFQANQAIGPLLMPRRLVRQALTGMIVRIGTLGVGEVIPDGRRQAAITLLVETFDVNPAVARIRLQDFFPLADGRQLTL